MKVHNDFGDSPLAEENGNNTTALMHLVVLHELHRMRLVHGFCIESIVPEKTVLLEKNGKEREGRFDFLVRTRDKTIGIEVLSRPTKGKMRNKLPYAESVDEFIFVLPESGLHLYRKAERRLMHERARPLFLPSEFNSEKLSAWLISLPEGRISEKRHFNKVFNVK